MSIYIFKNQAIINYEKLKTGEYLVNSLKTSNFASDFMGSR